MAYIQVGAERRRCGMAERPAGVQGRFGALRGAGRAVLPCAVWARNFGVTSVAGGGRTRSVPARGLLAAGETRLPSPGQPGMAVTSAAPPAWAHPRLRAARAVGVMDGNPRQCGAEFISGYFKIPSAFLSGSAVSSCLFF